jgi:hypothetical protein
MTAYEMNASGQSFARGSANLSFGASGISDNRSGFGQLRFCFQEVNDRSDGRSQINQIGLALFVPVKTGFNGVGNSAFDRQLGRTRTSASGDATGESAAPQRQRERTAQQSTANDNNVFEVEHHLLERYRLSVWLYREKIIILAEKRNGIPVSITHSAASHSIPLGH